MVMPRNSGDGRIFRRTHKRPNGEVIEMPTWWIEYYANGRQRRESSRSEHRRDAQALLRSRLAEIDRGTLLPIRFQKTQIGQLLDLLIDDYKVNQKSVDWAEVVAAHLRRYFGPMRASAAGSRDFTGYAVQRRNQDGVGNSTINRELALLGRAFNLGANAEPPLVASVPKIPKFAENNVRKGFFNHDAFVLLRSELPEHLRPVMTFAYFTGCRKGEILSLRWNQIDIAAGFVRLEPGETKNGEARTIPLIGELLQMIQILKEARNQLSGKSCDQVFSRFGEPIKNFYGAWKQASKRAGLVDAEGNPRFLFHDLRRTGVRNLIRAGVPERVAMMISGHKTRSVLDRYNIVDEKDLLLAGNRLEAYLGTLSGADKYKSSTSSIHEAGDEALGQGSGTTPKLLS